MPRVIVSFPDSLYILASRCHKQSAIKSLDLIPLFVNVSQLLTKPFPAIKNSEQASLSNNNEPHPPSLKWVMTFLIGQDETGLLRHKGKELFFKLILRRLGVSGDAGGIYISLVRLEFAENS